jgi:hypothetical protein
MYVIVVVIVLGLVDILRVLTLPAMHHFSNTLDTVNISSHCYPCKLCIDQLCTLKDEEVSNIYSLVKLP